MSKNVSILSLGPDAQRQAIEQFNAQQARKDPPPKFKNAAQVVDGYRFDSKRQAERYVLLKGLQSKGEITDLKHEPAWRIEINGVLICDYVADLAYRQNGNLIVEDVKSKITKTAAYRLKKKLMWAVLRIDVMEVA